MYLNNNLSNFAPNKLIMCLVVFAALLISGCGGGGGGGSVESKTGALTPASIAITPATGSTVAKGQTTHFTATATYTDNSTADITNKVSWSSGNTGVATIDKNTGVTTGISVGNTTVFATTAGVTQASASLIVTSAVVTGLTITSSTQSSPKGVPITYTATAAYSDNSSGNVSGSVTWASSNMGVATLSLSGLASTVGTGTVTITASLSGVASNSVSLTVTAAELTSISLSKTTGSAATKQVTVNGLLTDGTTATLGTLNWTSSNTGVATISNTGLLTAVNAGTTVISLSSGGVTSNDLTVSVALSGDPSICAFFGGCYFVIL